MKKFICLVLATVLVLASLALLYTDLLYRLFDKKQVDEWMNSIDQLTAQEQALNEEPSGSDEELSGEIDTSDANPNGEPEGKGTAEEETANTETEGTPNEKPAETENENTLKEEIADEEPQEPQGIERLGFDYFPLYTRTEQFCQKYVFKISEGDLNGFRNVLTDATNAYKAEGIMAEIYSLILIALLSIPVYMLLRLIPFNTLYKMSNETFALGRPFARGLVCLACSIVSVTVTWFIYRSTLYEFVLQKLTNWYNSFDSSKIAMNATNILIIVVVAIALIAILKKTLFRGSVVQSVLQALLRVVLIVIFFAFVNAFISIKNLTWYVALFALGALLLIGLIDLLIEPAKEKND